jgi:hypothetical protein
MDRESSREHSVDRTSWWVAGGLVLIALSGFGLVQRRAPLGSVDISEIRRIESGLRADGFVSTNSTHMHSEAVLGPIPISKILGTAKDSMSIPFEKNGSLMIGYEIKAGRAFNISINAAPTNITRAKRIAADLERANPALSVTVWTNNSEL